MHNHNMFGPGKNRPLDEEEIQFVDSVEAASRQRELQERQQEQQALDAYQLVRQCACNAALQPDFIHLFKREQPGHPSVKYLLSFSFRSSHSSPSTLCLCDYASSRLLHDGLQSLPLTIHAYCQMFAKATERHKQPQIKVSDRTPQDTAMSAIIGCQPRC